MKKLICTLIALSLLFTVAFASAETVKVGVVGATNEQWTDVLVPMLANEGIEIEIVYFSDYVMPNIALAEGDVDMNAMEAKLWKFHLRHLMDIFSVIQINNDSGTSWRERWMSPQLMLKNT